MTLFYPMLQGLAALTSLFAWLGAVLILFAYRSTIGALITALVNAIGGLSINIGIADIPIGAVLVGPIGGINNVIINALGAVVDSSQTAWHQWMQALAGSLTWIGEAVAYDMHEVGKAFGVLRRVTIPSLIADEIQLALNPVGFSLSQLRRHQSAAEQAIGSELLNFQRAAASAEQDVMRRIHRAEGAASGAAAAAIAIELPRIHGLERETTALEKWVKAHAHDLTVAGAVGLVLAAVTREFPWLKCNNSRSLMKHLCSWPIKAFEDLLGGVLDYLVLTNLCFLLTEMEKLSIQMLPYIEDATGVIDQLIGCQKSSVAKPIKLAYSSKITPWASLAA